MPKAHIVHGFNVHDFGENTTSRMVPFFNAEGIETEVFSYGWLGLMGVYFLNPRIVKQLIPKVSSGDIGIGHSNGCVILHMAAHFGAPFENLTYINPALNSKLGRAPQVGKLNIWHSPSDMVVKFGAWLRVLLPWAPLGDPLWGDMGAHGYQPGNYAEIEYEPSGVVNKIIHKINVACLNTPKLFFLFKVLSAPFAILYWFVLGPFEVALTYYYNNLRCNDPEIALNLSRFEDKKFILYSLVLPTLIWITCAYIWL